MKRVVHLGVGAFFRAHQAWYLEHSADRADWELVAFTGRSADIADTLNAQGNKYTLITRGPEGDELQTISILSAVHPGSDLVKLVEYLTDPDTAVVTLTITEAGYQVDTKSPADSALGRLALALAERAKSGSPIAIVPCDNLPSNGAVVAQALNSFTALGEQYLSFLDEKVSFVSTSIDRITPKTTQAELDLVKEAGLVDQSPVVTEPFSSWILSGEFPAGRPAWESAGAKFVSDIAPYESRKLWLLNGAHSLLANLGLVRGLSSIFDAMQDEVCLTALESWWASATEQLAGTDGLEGYLAQLRERFTNGSISHSLAQIAQDSTNKLAFRIAPVAAIENAKGQFSTGIVSALSAWVSLQLRGKAASDTRQPEADLAIRSEDPIQALLTLLDPRLASEPLLTAVREAVVELQQKEFARA
jgi:fructuronate reductase